MKTEVRSVVIKVIVILLLSMTILVITVVGYGIFREPDKPSVFTEVINFSDGEYQINFTEAGKGPKGDGTILALYSVNSDGSDLRLLGYVSSEEWQKESGTDGIFESMGHYQGNFQSPNGKRKLIIKTGYFNGFLSFFIVPKLYLEEDGQQKLLPIGGFNELKWLPDSKRVVFAGANGIGIIDVEKNQIGYLFNRPGFMIRVDER